MGTTSQKINYLNTTKQKFKQLINTVGGELTDENTFRSYVYELQELLIKIINGDVDLWDEYPKVTDSGLSPSVSNSEAAKMKITLNPVNIVQTGTPSVANPIPIKVITGNNTITILNKNLFNKNSFDVYNGNINISDLKMSSASANRTLWIKCKGNTTYTVQKRNDGDTNRFAIASSNVVPDTNSVLTKAIRGDNNKTLTLTTDEQDTYLIVQFYRTAETTLTYQQVIDSIQIEEGNQGTTYVEYQEQNFPINLGSIEYRIFGNAEDRIYRDTNGNWYIEENVRKRVVDGTHEDWIYSSYSNDTIYSAFARLSGKNFSEYRCDKVPYLTNISSYTTTEYCGTNGEAMRLGVLKSRLSEETIAGLKSWLSQNNITVYYERNTPVTTQITDSTLLTQLENIYQNAKSYENVTHVTQTNDDLSFELDISCLEKLDL